MKKKNTTLAWKQNLSFLAAAALITGFFYLIASSLPLEPAKKFEARTSAALLSALGTNATYTPPLLLSTDPSITVLTPSGSLTARITDLCVGAFELALLLGVILASSAPIRRRIHGCAGAFALVMLFNPLRIAAVLGVASSSGVQAADLAHDFIFRGLLVLAIVIYYAAWWKWTSTQQPHSN